MTHPSPVRIGLLRPQSNRNIGDTATFETAIDAYRRRVPGIEIISIVPEPEESGTLLGTPGFPLYGNGGFVPLAGAHGTTAADRLPSSGGRLASARRIYKFLGELDAIVFTGGGVLDDYWGGAWELPFFTLVWVGAARLRGVKVAFHGIGFDRLTTRQSRFLAVRALNLADYRSFRDAESRDIMQGMGLSAASDVVPDMAFGLAPRTPPVPASEPFVLLNPVSERMWTRARDGSATGYLETFVAAARALLDRGIAVKLCSTQETMDKDAVEYVADALRAEGREGWEHSPTNRLEDFMELSRRARLVVSSRFHGLVLAMVAGTPVLCVSPMRKMKRLMRDAGLAEFSLDMDEVDAGRLIANIDRALTDEPRLRRLVVEKAAEYRRLVDESFDRMVGGGLLGEEARRRFLGGRAAAPAAS